jgi:Motility related/secretion protein
LADPIPQARFAATLRLAPASAAALAVLVFAAGGLAAQEPAQQAPAVPGPVLRLPYDTLKAPADPALLPGGRLGLRIPAWLVAARWKQQTERILAAQRTAQRHAWMLQPQSSPRAALVLDTLATPAALAGGIRRTPTPTAAPTFAAVAQYANLALQLHARLEMKFDRLKNEHCTSADLLNPISGCQSGFPTPSIDQQFGILAGGFLGDRVHVNVDYDTQREFTASNNISVYYQGLEDEILKRVDVGNVTFNAPPSRFITAAVPSNSFGVQAQAQLGPFEFRSIVAQQKGSQLVTRTYTVGNQTTQPVDREARDLDYEEGRFFFVVDPRTLPKYPAVDVLNLDPGTLPASERPVQVRVYRLRAQAIGQTNPNIGGITAVALRKDSPQRVGPLPWELLVEGRDYYIDPSGMWFTLAAQVGDQDFLAVSYVTAAGDTVGTFPAVGRARSDTLELIYQPKSGPDLPTFAYEMRNVYRIGSSDVDRNSIGLTIRVNGSASPLDGRGTYLGRLGLALQSDATTLDVFNRVFPRTRDPNGGAPIKDLFVVFPTLRPFADSSQLQPSEQNDSLYQTPEYLLSTQGPPPTFRLEFSYQEVGAGDRTTLNLGAIQIREGSEKLYIGSTQLIRGQDYTIDYGVGTVTFSNPDSLFHGSTEVTAQFEQNQVFDQAPRNLLGFATTYNLGTVGQINAIGIWQHENSAQTRPALGFEPQANFIGGLSTQLQFEPDGITRALNAFPLIHTTVPSRLTLNGEVAVSRPNPNPTGQAYLENFEGQSYTSISLLQNRFQVGSAPSSGAGIPAADLSSSGGFDPVDAVPLVWQNTVQLANNDALQFTPQEIDSTIVLTGAAQTYETVLWLSLKPDTIGGAPDPTTGAPRWYRPHTPGPRWRSITQPLGSAGVGLDLSRVEYLEFWVLEDAERTAKSEQTDVVFDFGTVFEDAVAMGPDSFTVTNGDTTFSGLQFIGKGRLDTERDTLTGVFNAAVNDNGILGDILPSVTNAGTGEVVHNLPMCQLAVTAGLPLFPLGDLATDCTRGNGSPDTEDLNGDNRLDLTVGQTQENFFRYVFPIGDERYHVRDGVATVDGKGRRLVWRLYRIPFQPDTLEVGDPDIHQIQSLRITVVTPDQGAAPEQEFYVALARMRLLGAPWLKRSETPIAGLSGTLAQPHGEVIASTVSTDNQDLGYTPPPGVVDAASEVGAGFQFTSQQINETSLRVLAHDLRAGERAEAYTQFADEADKNLLNYRTLRVWARGRGPGWEDGDLQFYIKLGHDASNFYLYRTDIRSTSWTPEVVIDLQRWLLLRAQIEAAWLRGDPPSGSATCGGDSTAYVACDGPYMVQVRDPAVAPPNLARVADLSVGIYRVKQTVFIDQAELWVDDIRLSDVVDDPGLAGAVNAHLQAADVADLDFSYQSVDDRFRQLSETPTYVGNASASYGGTFRLDKLLPSSWHLSMPLTTQFTRASSAPYYLDQTDVLASVLPNLRQAQATGSAYSLSLRRVERGNTLLERMLLDPVSVDAALQNGRSTTQLNDAATRNRQLRVGYNNAPGANTIRAVPNFLVSFVDALPGFISHSAFAKALHGARLRWNPFQWTAATTLTNDLTTQYSYRVPVLLASDSAVLPTASRIHTLRNELGLALQPFSSLGFRVNYTTTRDLQHYGDSTTIGRLLERQRATFLGTDVGAEQARTLTTSFNVAPVVASWLRPRYTLSTSFGLNRDPNGRTAVRTGPDSTGAFRVPESLINSRHREMGLTVDLGTLFGNLFGASGGLGRVLKRILPFDYSQLDDWRSTFDRVSFDPSFRYQLALGGIDEFRYQDSIPATSAAQARTRTFSGGASLPLGFSVRGNYRDQALYTWSLRGITGDQGELVQTSKEWPSATASWTYTPPGIVAHLLSSVSASAAVRTTTSSTIQPPLTTGGQGSTTESKSSTVSPSVTLTWAGGIVSSFDYTKSQTDQTQAGNVTSSDREDWTGNLSFAFRPPKSIVRMTNDIRTTVTVSSSVVSVCLLSIGTALCTPISDSHRHSLDLQMETGFSSAVRGGASFSYVQQEQRYISQKTAQMTFTIFAEINFVSGQVR